MNRWTALAVGYFVLALEGPVADALHVGPPGRLGAAPSLVVPFVIFIALSAPAATALWTAIICGLVIDITPRQPDALIVLGPHALGLLAAAYLTITVRPMMVRSNPISLVVLSVVAAAVAGLVVTTAFTLRGVWHGAWADGGATAPLADLRDRAFSALYTGVTAAVLAAILYPMQGLFGFQDPARRGPFVRRY
jgi:rod shape-determining protein MreD